MSIVQDIIATNAFVGHPKNQSNPKTRDVRLPSVHNGRVLFDPQIVAKQLEDARKLFEEAKKSGKEILIICEKDLFKEEIKEMAERVGIHYLNHKVPAGVLTNFDTLLSRVRSLKSMKSYIESSSFQSLTKKEQAMKKRALKKIEQVYQGVTQLKRRPDMVILVDAQFMHKFVYELKKTKIQGLLLASSNFDLVVKNAHIVNCNVNSKNSLQYVLKYILGL